MFASLLEIIGEAFSLLLFIKSRDAYYCEISFKEVKKENFTVDYNLNYNLFKAVMNSKLQPYQLEFSYFTDKTRDDCIFSTIINREDFEKINSSEDLAIYIENNKSSSN